ncbi:hypothetical protein SAMN04487825_10392 [Prevotella sp. kh1p2]|nr:hypothetical protein SAMN04487825_10392 [Prevotella sp. kh1p2]
MATPEVKHGLTDVELSRGDRPQSGRQLSAFRMPFRQPQQKPCCTGAAKEVSFKPAEGYLQGR